MAKENSSFCIDRRRLLAASAAATATAAGFAPHIPRVAAASAADISAARGPVFNVSAGMARRLLEIARRNAIGREAGLASLAPIRELRRMKTFEMEQEFAKFEAAHGPAVLEQVLEEARRDPPTGGRVGCRLWLLRGPAT